MAKTVDVLKSSYEVLSWAIEPEGKHVPNKLPHEQDAHLRQQQMEEACRSAEQPFSVICLVASGVGKNGLLVTPKPYEIQLWEELLRIHSYVCNTLKCKIK